MLAADADLHVASGLTALLDRDLHQPADAGGVERFEGVDRKDLLLDVLQQELALGVVAGEAEGRLGEVIGAEGEELRDLRDVAGGQRGSGDLDHGPELVRDLGLLLGKDFFDNAKDRLVRALQLVHVTDQRE